MNALQVLPEAQLALDKAKIALMADKKAVFFTTVCLSLKHAWNDAQPTACTDGLNIWYNQKFMLAQSPPVRLSVLLHEINHVTFQHVARGKNFNQRKYNYAADYVINIMLQDAGYEIPSDWLIDPQYRGMSTEEVYKLLPEPPPSFQCDIYPSDKPPKELGEILDNILVRAGMAAAQAGCTNVPAELQIYIDKLVNPKLPWHRILQKIAVTLVKRDYSFRKPNRRFFPQYLLPTARSESIDNFAVIVDTSGSITGVQFNHFISETLGILKQIKPKKISFVQFDTSIKAVNEITQSTDIKNIKFCGRGGTRIKPVMDWIQDNKPTAAIIFTDGHFTAQPLDRKTPVFWVIHGNPNFTSKFGKIIHYNFVAA